MFGIKRFIKKNILYPRFLFPKTTKFPEKPVSPIRIKARLFGLLNKVKEQKKQTGIGNLLTYPDKQAIKAWSKLLSFNTNNLGNWSIKNIKPNQETTLIEQELITKMIDLYHGDKDDLEGYVTTGGTESNIFSAWMGRKFLENKGAKIEEICLIKTNLTHYSIEKSADIVGIKTFITPLNEKTWVMDPYGFKKTTERLMEKDYKGFLLPITLGYTVGGTSDPYEKICQEIKNLRKSRGVEFFVWMDGALNGLIEPFLNKSFRPFSCPEIQLFLTDFHKIGGVPYPAGIVLYRSSLRKLIEKTIDYLPENDSTLLGSRPGATAVAIWAIIHKYGKKRYFEIIQSQLELKNFFIQKIKEILPKTEIITGEKSLSCGLIFRDFEKDSIPDNIANKFGLYTKPVSYEFMSGSKKTKIYKIYFLPHVKKEVLKKLLSDLRKTNANQQYWC